MVGLNRFTNRCTDEILFRDQISRQLGFYLTLPEYQHAIAHVDQFVVISRVPENCRVSGSQLTEQAIDFGFCPHIDTPRAVEHHQDLWLRRQELGQDDLLLVSAAEALHGVSRVGYCNREAVDRVPDHTALGNAIDEAHAEELGQNAEGDVICDRLGKEQAVGRAVLGH
jgi:hypothetical protein